jgi:Protein of unknown function with HXXEE motif
MTRFEGTFFALVTAQAAHSVEEYFGRLWEVFPPAAFVAGLVSADRQRGFVIINVALFAFGLWCFFWPVHRRWPVARLLVGGWILIEVINGIGHPLWTFRQHGYTPGVATAPALLLLALSLTWQLKKNPAQEDRA